MEETGPTYILWLAPRCQHRPGAAEVLIKGVPSVRERVQGLESAQALHEPIALVVKLSPAHVDHGIDQWRHRCRHHKMRSAILGDSGSGGGGEEEHRSHSNYVRKSRPVRAGRRERFSSPTCATQPELPQNLHQGVPTGVITGQEGKARKGELGSRREDSLHVVLTHSVTHIITQFLSGALFWRGTCSPRAAAPRRSPEDGRGGARMSWETADLGVIAVLALVLCALLPNVLAVKRRLRNAATKR